MTAPIHYRGSIGEQVILMQNLSKSVPMKNHYTILFKCINFKKYNFIILMNTSLNTAEMNVRNA